MKNCASGACRHFCVLVLGAAVAFPVLAEDQLEEVVVTARRVEEMLAQERQLRVQGAS